MITHGLKNKIPRLYNIWKNMRQRCNNPKRTDYNKYGGRGITICSEWNDYSEFYNWSIRNGYDKNLTLDRINNDHGYNPNNCRWTDRTTQMRNTRLTVKINGIPLRELAEKNGINPDLALERYRRGVSEDGLFIKGYLPRNQFKEAKLNG